MTAPNTPNAREFAATLDNLALSDLVHDYHTVSGLILAVASAPELIPPSEWLGLVFIDDDSPALPSMDGAEQLFGQLMAMWNHWATVVGDDEANLPLDPAYRLVDGVPSPEFSAFSRGVLMGYGWLEEDWSGLLEALAEAEEFEEIDGVFGMTLASAMLIADPDGAFEAMAEAGEVPEEGGLELVDAAEFLPVGLRLLGSLGFTMAGGDDGDETDDAPHINPNRDVGRNDPCPCGSGKKFKNCCLN